MLRTEPSFSIYDLKDEVVEKDENGEKLERTVTIGESIESVGSGEFSFGKNGNSMALIEENGNEAEEEEGEGGGKGASLNEFKSFEIEDDAAVNRIQESELGINGGGFDSGQSGCHENEDHLEEYYKRIVLEDPSNPFFMKNYAQLLQVLPTSCL